MFGTYMSEGDFMSDSIQDSITLFSELPDFAGSCIFDQGGAATAATKKKESQKSKRLEPVQSVVLVQKLNLPLDIQHCSSVTQLIPTPDGTQLIVVLGSKAPQSLHMPGAILLYNVLAECNTVVLDQNFVIRKFEHEDELPSSSSCFVPVEGDKMALACVLRNGGVSVFNLTDLAISSTITRSASDPKITSVSYCSSKFFYLQYMVLRN